MCGAVLDDHLRDESAEWRDFGTVEDIARGNAPGKRARCGDVPVDESRWLGGLMSTTVGREHRSTAAAVCGNNEERYKLAALRQRLKRTQNMINHMLEKDQKEQYRDFVLGQKARAAKAARGEQEENTTTTSIHTFEDTTVTVAGDYEGLMAAERNNMEQSQISTTIISSSNTKAGEKFTALNHKWSLTHAIILHGTLQHVQQYTSDYEGNTNEEWTHSNLEAERKLIHNKFDSVTKTSTHKLYVAFALLEKAAMALNFHGMANGTFREAISCLVKFASERDDLKISGISNGKRGRHLLDHQGNDSLSLSLFSTSEVFQSILSSYSKEKLPSKKLLAWNELQRIKQYASLGAAILYVAAKRTGVGRTLAEVCSAFGTFEVLTEEKKDNTAVSALVRPKYCSRAMEELKQAIPGLFLPPKEETAAAALLPISSSSTPVLSPLPLESIARVTPDYLPSDIMSTSVLGTIGEDSALADLTSRMTSSLNLPSSAAEAAIAVAVQCKRSSKDAKKTPKYIRPRQRRAKSAIKNDSDEIIAAASILLVSTAGGILQRLANQALNNSETTSKAQVDTLASWSEWNSQPSWHREVLQLEQSTGLSSKSILSCYSNTLHPHRAQLLGAVKRKFELVNSGGEKYLQNIVVAVPLMSTKS